MLHCFKCGADLPDNVIYCLQCGDRLDGADDAETVLRQPKTKEVVTPDTSPKVSRSPLSPFVVIQIAGAIILASILLIVLIGGLKSPSSYFPPDAPQNRINDNVANASPRQMQTPQAPSPTATPLPNWNPVMTERVNQPNCEVTAPAQLHVNCDTADCDIDPSTVAPTLGIGERVVRHGTYRQARGRLRYRWELVSNSIGQFWIASNKLRCDELENANPNQPTRPPTCSDFAQIEDGDPLRAVCKSGRASYWQFDKGSTCLLQGGVREWCRK